MPEMKLDVTDAAEEAEMPHFLSQWLGRDPARRGPSLDDFGHPGSGIAQPRQDLERFVFLPDGSDGEPLFGPAQQQASISASAAEPPAPLADQRQPTTATYSQIRNRHRGQSRASGPQCWPQSACGPQDPRPSPCPPAPAQEQITELVRDLT